MTEEEEFEEVDDFDLFIEEKNIRIKELEKENEQLKTQIEKMKFDVGVTFNTAKGYALINKWEKENDR